MSLRPDGATRGDLAEASALILAGLMLSLMPAFALLDRMERPWIWLSASGGLAGLLIAGLGVRWFFVEGPQMVSTGAEMEPLIHDRPTPELPFAAQLVDARRRLLAHGIRFTALGSGFALLLLPGGSVWGVVVALFIASVLADQLLLRPHRYVLDAEGLRSDWWAGGGPVKWAEVRKVVWRHYPGKERPPFPTGERLVLELRDGDDREFVFHHKYGGTDSSVIVRALAPALGERLEILRPTAQVRVEPPPTGDEEPSC